MINLQYTESKNCSVYLPDTYIVAAARKAEGKALERIQVLWPGYPNKMLLVEPFICHSLQSNFWLSSILTINCKASFEGGGCWWKFKFLLLVAPNVLFSESIPTYVRIISILFSFRLRPCNKALTDSYCLKESVETIGVAEYFCLLHPGCGDLWGPVSWCGEVAVRGATRIPLRCQWTPPYPPQPPCAIQ